MFSRAMTGAAIMALGLVLLAPVAALAVAAILDVGPPPDFPVRISVFPLALTLFDPLVWTGFWNSLTVAAFVACGSVALGLPLSHALARWRFWGRPVLSALVMGPAVDPSGLPCPGPARALRFVLARGMAVARVGLECPDPGVALVVFTLVWTLGGLDPDREAAARLAGAGTYRTWRAVSWPLIRPATAGGVRDRAGDHPCRPGAPLVLGLRRTLGFELVAGVTRSDALPRVATLALIVAGVSLAVRGAARAMEACPLDLPRRRRSPGRLASMARWPRAAISCAILGAWALLAWLPVVGLGRLGLASEPYSEDVRPPPWRASWVWAGALPRKTRPGSCCIR